MADGVALRHVRARCRAPKAINLPRDYCRTRGLTSLIGIWGKNLRKSSLCGSNQCPGELADFNDWPAGLVQRRADSVAGRTPFAISRNVAHADAAHGKQQCVGRKHRPPSLEHSGWDD